MAAERVPPTLRIRLFGELDLRRDDTPLPPLESSRAASLLGYLLLHRDAPQPRQRIAFLLWPDSTEAQARTNLRHVLHNLRRTIPDADRFLDVRGRTLQWRRDAPCWIDVAAFEAALARSERADADAPTALREAIEVYRGHALEGSYDEWIATERERLRHRYLAALGRLTALLAEGGDDEGAIAAAERLLREDPLREDTYRLLMRLHDARGDRARALHVYHLCATALERELEVEPSAETREAYELLLRGESVGGTAGSETVRAASWPLVGRAVEWAGITDVWRHAEGGRSQLLVVTGEAGTGKTRLVEELRSWCAHRGAATAEARSYAAEGALAYAPLAAWLRSPALAGRLARLDRGRASELARLLPELGSSLGMGADGAPDAAVDPRLRLFDAAAHAILTVGRPLVLVADDLHWGDRDTLQFLHYLLRSAAGARLLVAATARREELDPDHPLNDLMTGLRGLDRCTEIALGSLSRADAATLASRVGGRALDETAAGRLFAATDGNPLFIVEAVRAGWTAERATGAWMTPRVQAVIESRLAQLSPPARELADISAVMGREIAAEVLRHVADVDERTLVRALDELWRRGILREHGSDRYDFAHQRVRDVAYRSLSPAVRRRHHLRIARALEHLHRATAGSASADVAAHYDRGGAIDDAVRWYQRAADAAHHVYATAEGIRLIERALELIRSRPESAARDERELATLAALPALLGWAEGYASPRLAAVHARALQLARALGVEPAAPLLRSLAVSALSAGDFAGARRWAEQLRVGGERDGDEVRVVEGSYVLGIAAFWQGDLVPARGHFERAIERYCPEHARTHLLRYGLDPKVVCLGRLAVVHWFLGDERAAVRTCHDALSLADELGHPFTRGVALVFGALLALEMHDVTMLRDQAARLREMHASQPRQVQVVADVLEGYLEALDGRTVEGLTRARRAVEGAPQADAAPGMHAFLDRVLLATCAVSAEPRLGASVAERLLTQRGEVRLWDAEARRLRAAFLDALDEERSRNAAALSSPSDDLLEPRRRSQEA